MIELSLNEAESLAAKVARGAGFAWGLADDVGRAARALATHDEPWAEALLALAQSAGGFAPPSPERASLWLRREPDRASAAPLCPVRAAAFLVDESVNLGEKPLRLARVGLPIWLRGFLTVARAPRCIVDYGSSTHLSAVADVTISHATFAPSSPLARRAPIERDALIVLGSIAARIYVPESERSRVRGAGGGSVDED